MADQGTVTFKGLSGESYEFKAYPITQAFRAVGAVYFITNRYPKDGTFYFKPIYVGITGDLSTRFADHHKDACFARNAANFICIHMVANEATRRSIETDLIKNYNPPCNG